MSIRARTEARQPRHRLNLPIIDADALCASWGEVSPDFFKGAVVEKQAAEVLTGGGWR